MPADVNGFSCWAVIPARGGSKRVPRKNTRKFLGRPMIAYTIEAAFQSNLFSRVIVSTDDAEIAEVSEQAGAEVPFLRESGLADDYTPVSTATLDALEKLDADGTSVEYVAQLLACCPLRTAEDIRASYTQFARTKADSQISITRFGWQNPWWAVERDDVLRLTPLFAQQMSRRSQDLPELYCVVGAVWWSKADVLRKEKTFHIPNRTGWEIPWQRSLDIDSEEDFVIAELLMGSRAGSSAPCAAG
jgi:CMP-N-acetylneuraminic acid synthetase